MTKRKIQYWVIPPKENAEFVANMENVLQTYALPYNSSYPVLCMDEQPVQFFKETRKPIPATKNHPRRVDYEYERAGTACVFMFNEPLAGWRKVSVRTQRKKIDWAEEMEELLTTRYKNAEKVILVCDNLNTHTRGAFYEAFAPDKALELLNRVEFCYTPKHGSWLNMSENELSSLTRQCITGRRLSDIELFRTEAEAWAKYSNEQERGINWKFQTSDARIKLNRLYPKI